MLTEKHSSLLSHFTERGLTHKYLHFVFSTWVPTNLTLPYLPQLLFQQLSGRAPIQIQGLLPVPPKADFLVHACHEELVTPSSLTYLRYRYIP